MTVALLMTLAILPAERDDGVIEINFPPIASAPTCLPGRKNTDRLLQRVLAGHVQAGGRGASHDMSYIEKMTILAHRDLPDIIEGKGGIVSLAVKNGQRAT